jgi:hypothetical protein
MDQAPYELTYDEVQRMIAEEVRKLDRPPLDPRTHATMQAFDDLLHPMRTCLASRRCCKCGSLDLELDFRAKDSLWLEGRDRPETDRTAPVRDLIRREDRTAKLDALVCRCRTCRYTWDEVPKDERDEKELLDNMSNLAVYRNTMRGAVNPCGVDENPCRYGSTGPCPGGPRASEESA